ncbi:putative cytochrome p450 [Neofusicoccum parvum]|uniref:Cytochrome p450 n=1 Tax=Neofusicoccum parvum TaxID=310453 RepID=A0ACB5SDH0_9PEZI|nr:putative cytochrome p450 [Neofusicoccum parvum]
MNIVAILAVPALLSVVVRLLQIVYRLYFHPLSKFQGLRSASISRTWLNQQVQKGFPEEAFDKLHRKLGTKALRIGPNELHISDVSLYKVIYSQVNPFPKHAGFYDEFNTPHTLATETNRDLHKERRKLLNPLFSRAAVTKLEPVILEKIHAMGTKIKRISNLGPIDIDDAVRCMAADIISEFAFGQSFNLIDESPDSFKTTVLECMNIATRTVVELYHNNVQRLANRLLPRSLVGVFDPTIKALADLLGVAARSVKTHKQRTEATSQLVVFDKLSSLPTELQTTQAVEILIAGSDTTAFTISMALFHILRNERIKNRLINVVKGAVKDPEHMPSYTELDRVEYLHAVVKESLRIAMPVPGMLRRVVPAMSTPFIVDGKVVPPGTVVGMSAYTMHTATEIWGLDAKEFNPDRWLGDKAAGMESYLVTFSKGSRTCIGINIAYAEVTLVLAYLFRAFSMNLKPTRLKYEDMFTLRIKDSSVLVDFEVLEV